jgi:hypothetical protein
MVVPLYSHYSVDSDCPGEACYKTMASLSLERLDHGKPPLSPA